MLSWLKGKTESAPALEEKPKPRPQLDKGPGWFARLRDRLRTTSQALAGKLRLAIGLSGKIDDALLEEIESILIQADVGGRAAAKIVDKIRRAGSGREEASAERVMGLVKESVMEILSVNNRALDLKRPAPTIILVVGVNGTGKTTTIGKLALELSRQGKQVMLVAADTFRAAAADQLQIWANRTGAQIVRKGEGADPASVCFEALETAQRTPPNVILVDTAGRLHTKTYLMDELSKVVRVIKKIYPDAPHETILVLDATTGQNAINQTATFKEVVPLTGLIMTKLDGTAKGGILIALKETFGLPIFKIGVGETPEDLRDFEPGEFADALFVREEEAS